MVYDVVMDTKKFISTILIASQLFVSLPASADVTTIPPPPPPVPGEVDVGAAISPMKKGQTAPFTGVLLSPKATATIVAQLNLMQEQIKIEVDHARGEERAKCDFNTAELRTRLETDKVILQAQIDEHNKRIDILTDQLKKEESSRPSAGTWFGIGGLAGVGLTILTVFAIGKATR